MIWDLITGLLPNVWGYLAAAGAALAPTVAPLQESAHELVVRMATATEEVAA